LQLLDHEDDLWTTSSVASVRHVRCTIARTVGYWLGYMLYPYRTAPRLVTRTRAHTHTTPRAATRLVSINFRRTSWRRHRCWRRDAAETATGCGPPAAVCVQCSDGCFLLIYGAATAEATATAETRHSSQQPAAVWRRSCASDQNANLRAATAGPPVGAAGRSRHSRDHITSRDRQQGPHERGDHSWQSRQPDRHSGAATAANGPHRCSYWRSDG
jgi:hypothetical protein